MEGSNKQTEAQLVGGEREEASIAWGRIETPRIESCMPEPGFGRQTLQQLTE